MKTARYFSRRSFISTTALALSGGLLASETNLFGASKKKTIAVGCRDVHLKVGGHTDCWAAMKALGAEALEAQVDLDLSCVGLFKPDRKYSLATDDGIQQLKDDLQASGCVITAFMMANHFDERLDKELECARRLVKAGEKLGVHAIRIDIVPRAIPGDQFLPFAIETGKKLSEIAKGSPVRFGVENHGPWGNNPEVLEKLFDGVNSTQFGLTMDPGNFYWWGLPLKDLYKVYEKFASRAIHLHCKSIRYPEDQKNVQRKIGFEYGKYCCPITEGDVDYKRVIKILKKANYCGDLCVEDESLGKFPADQRAEIVKKQIAMLKRLV